MQKMISPGEVLNILVMIPQKNTLGEFYHQPGVIQVGYEQLLATFARTPSHKKQGRAKPEPKEKIRNTGPAFDFNKAVESAFYKIEHGRHKSQKICKLPKIEVQASAVQDLLNAFERLPADQRRYISTKCWDRLKRLKLNEFGLPSSLLVRLDKLFHAFEL